MRETDSDVQGASRFQHGNATGYRRELTEDGTVVRWDFLVAGPDGPWQTAFTILSGGRQ